MNARRISIAAALFLIAFSTSIAQVRINVITRSPMPAELSAWQRDRSLVQVSFTSPAETPAYNNAQVAFIVRSSETGAIVARSKDRHPGTPRISLPPGPSTLIRHGPDLIDQRAVDIDAAYRSASIATNRLPEGRYEFCVRLLASDGSEIATTGNTCGRFQVVHPDPARPIEPVDGAVLGEGALPRFLWTPGIAAGMPARSQIRLVPVYPGQSRSTAIERNAPIIDKITTGNSYHYSPADPPLNVFAATEGFAWQVRMIDAGGNTLSSSPVFTFRPLSIPLASSEPIGGGAVVFNNNGGGNADAKKDDPAEEPPCENGVLMDCKRFPWKEKAAADKYASNHEFGNASVEIKGVPYTPKAVYHPELTGVRVCLWWCPKKGAGAAGGTNGSGTGGANDGKTGGTGNGKDAGGANDAAAKGKDSCEKRLKALENAIRSAEKRTKSANDAATKAEEKASKEQKEADAAADAAKKAKDNADKAAQDAKDAADAAKKAAEDAKKAAEEYRRLKRSGKGTKAEKADAREKAEETRKAAEEAEKAAEDAKKEAEKAKREADAAAKKAAKEKAEADKAKKEADAKRKKADDEQKRLDDLRSEYERLKKECEEKNNSGSGTGGSTESGNGSGDGDGDGSGSDGASEDGRSTGGIGEGASGATDDSKLDGRRNDSFPPRRDPPTDGQDVIDTEIVQLELTGSGVTVKAAARIDCSKIRASRGTAATGGMIIAGAPGSVPAGAGVTITDKNGKKATTTAGADGSFSVGEADLPAGFDHTIGNTVTVTVNGVDCVVTIGL